MDAEEVREILLEELCALIKDAYERVGARWEAEDCRHKPLKPECLRLEGALEALRAMMAAAGCW